MSSNCLGMRSLLKYKTTTCHSMLLIGLVGCGPHLASSVRHARTNHLAREGGVAVDRYRQESSTGSDSIGALEQPSSGAPSDNESPISLAGLIEYAEQHSPRLRLIEATRHSADAEQTAASVVLPYNPQVSIAIGPRFSVNGTGFDIQASLMQQIEIADQRGARMQASSEYARLVDSEIAAEWWLLRCDLHRAFHNALLMGRRAAIASQVVEFQLGVLTVVERQIAVGDVAPLTLRLAQVEVAQARQVLIAREQDYYASRIAIAQLVGWPASSPPIPQAMADAEYAVPTYGSLSQEALANVPALAVARQRVVQAAADVRTQEREAWLSPSIGLMYQREGNQSVEGANDILFGALSFSIPSFETNQGGVARARARFRIAERELELLERDLEGNLLRAISSVEASMAQIRGYRREILPRFEENLRLLSRSFELGEIDIMSLSAGRERFLAIEGDALGAELAYLNAVVELERLIGVPLVTLDASSVAQGDAPQGASGEDEQDGSPHE